MDSISTIKAVDDNSAMNPVDSTVFRRSLRRGFLVFLASSVLGEVYSLITHLMVYGPFSIFLGPSVLDTSLKGAYQVAAAHVILYASLALGAIAFWLLRNAFKVQGIGTKPDKRVRLGLIFISVNYVFTLIPLILTLIIGSSVENARLTFSGTNLFEDILVVLAYLLFVTLAILLVVGMFLGAIGGSITAATRLKRGEFLIVAPLFFVGMFNYATGIAACGMVFWATSSDRFTMNRGLHFLLNGVNKLAKSETLARRISTAVLVISSFLFVVSIYFSYQVSLYVDRGLVLWYQSPLVSGQYLGFMSFGLTLTPYLIFWSVHNLINSNKRLVSLEDLTAAGIIVFLIAVLLFFQFYTPPRVVPYLLFSWRSVMQRPVLLSLLGFGWGFCIRIIQAKKIGVPKVQNG